MMRVVLDTNVVVSALLKPEGKERLVLQLALNNVLRLCVSPPVLAEYETVLRRPRLRLDPALVEEGLADIYATGNLVRPSRTISVSRDDADNRFLECAEAAGADYLVTGNLRHFPKEWKGTRIANARELIELLA